MFFPNLQDLQTYLRRPTCRRDVDLCSVLADLTLLKVGPGREDRQRKVSLGVHADDVVFALQGVNFFRNLIGELNKGA